MEEIKRDKAPEKTDGGEDRALDDKALETAAGGFGLTGKQWEKRPQGHETYIDGFDY